MVTLVDLNKSINKVLKSQFSTIKRYSNDIEEGFKKPCFFTQIVPMTMDYETVNFTSNKLMIVINYFSKDEKEKDHLQIDANLRRAFGMTLKVNQRSFLLQNIRSERVDRVLQFRFDMNFFDGIEKQEIHELMDELDLEIKRSEE